MFAGLFGVPLGEAVVRLERLARRELVYLETRPATERAARVRVVEEIVDELRRLA